MLNELELNRTWVALESHAIESFDARAMLARFLPATKTFLSDFVGQVKNTDHAISFTRQQSAFISLVENHKYLDLAPLGAWVPEGLTVPYLKYLGALSPLVDHACQAPARLTEFSTKLAMVLSNPEARRDTQDSSAHYKQVEAERAALHGAITPCFKNGSHSTDSTYGKVIARNTDWPEVFAETDRLVNEMNTVNRKALEKTAQDTAHLVDRLVSSVHEGKIVDTTPELVKSLAEGAFQVATELEAFAAQYYRVAALASVIGQTTLSLSKVIKAM